MTQGPCIGYLGVDVLNNATICNEASGLTAAGVPLDVASVQRFSRPTFYREETLGSWAREILYLSPLRPWSVALDVARAPWIFGRRFWTTLWGAITCPAEGPLQKLGIVWHLLPALELALRWRGRRVQHIHAHWAHTATTIAMHTAHLLGVGFSFTGHANDLFVHKVGLVGKIRRARFIVCISEFHRRFYLQRGADPDRLAVVYCGIDVDRFRPSEDGPTAEARIVAVGRLVEKKGFADLILACDQLKQRGRVFECVIAGSGPEEARLNALIERLGLGDQVRVTGKNVLQEDLPALLRSARVVALPCVRDRDGDMDGLPQVLIEAMASGIPVVSTRLVGIPDLVWQGHNGLLVNPADVPALAEALDEVLFEPRRAEALGARANPWVQAHFSRAEAVERLSRLFAWAAAHPGTTPPDSQVRFASAPGSSSEYEPGLSRKPSQSSGIPRPHSESPQPVGLRGDRD